MDEVSRVPANAGSPHSYGDRAAEFLDRSRSIISSAIGCTASEIVFTSGATEANNIAILGSASCALKRGRRKIIVSAAEHKSVLAPARELARRGFVVREIPLHKSGEVDLERFVREIDDEVLIVSIMLANNVTGIIQPVARIASAARARGASIHCDAAQAVGKVPVNVSDLGIDYLSISAHKVHGPMGVGALFISGDAPPLTPLIFGGGQEGGLRSGTVPVPLVVGFANALGEAIESLEANAKRAEMLADQLVQNLRRHQVRLIRLGENTPKLPGSIAALFADIEADDLVARLNGRVQLSAGSACETGSVEPSHVLAAMGLTAHEARSFIRILIDPALSEAAGDCAATMISNAYAKAVLATGDLHQ